MRAAVALEQRLLQFVSTARQLIAATIPTSGTIAAATLAWGPAEDALEAQRVAATEGADEAFRDDFDTPTALQRLGELMTAANTYMHGADRTGVNPPLLGAVVADIVGAFRATGVELAAAGDVSDIGWGAENYLGGADSAAAGGGPAAVDLAPTVDALVAFRGQIRVQALAAAKSGGAPLEPAALLRACDSARDALAAGSPRVVLQDTRAGSAWRLAP
jgi:cysteinyl-tRNA synthetase